MIHKVGHISPDGGQAGEAVYKYYEIHSDKTELDGYGMYMDGDKEVACWCEVKDKNGTFYLNTSIAIKNEQVALGNFADYCKRKFPEVKFTEFRRLQSSDDQ